MLSSRADSAVRISTAAHEEHTARPARLNGGGYDDAAYCAGATISSRAPLAPAAPHFAFAPQAVTAWANLEAETEDS